MTDQLNGAWGARLLYGEPVGPIPSELSHGRGSVASMFTSTDTCRAVFRGFEGLLWHLADIRAPQHKTFC